MGDNFLYVMAFDVTLWDIQTKSKKREFFLEELLQMDPMRRISMPKTFVKRKIYSHERFG